MVVFIDQGATASGSAEGDSEVTDETIVCKPGDSARVDVLEPMLSALLRLMQVNISRHKDFY